MKKKLFIFLCLFFMVFFSQNIFAYNFRTHIYDYAGRNVYNVAVNDFSDGTHVTQIIDLNTGIFYCFPYPYQAKSAAMSMYQYLSTLNAVGIEEIIRITKWGYWFTQDWALYYKAIELL